MQVKSRKCSVSSYKKKMQKKEGKRKRLAPQAPPKVGLSGEGAPQEPRRMVVRVGSFTSGSDPNPHYLISDRVVRPRWEGWTVKIEDSGPIGELPPQTMIGDDPKPLEANGGARGITYFRI